MLDEQSRIQWQKRNFRCVIDIKDPSVKWKGQVQLDRLKFSRGSGGLLVYFPNEEYLLIEEGKVYISGYIISVAEIDGDTYTHVAWSTEGRQYEATTSANHWFAIALNPFTTLRRKHIARMNKFVRRTVGRNDAETWVL